MRGRHGCSSQVNRDRNSERKLSAKIIRTDAPSLLVVQSSLSRRKAFKVTSLNGGRYTPRKVFREAFTSALHLNNGSLIAAHLR